MSRTSHTVAIIPRATHDIDRARELSKAILRYLNDSDWPPHEWGDELAEITERYSPVKITFNPRGT